MTNKRFGEGAR